jgi:hypothetical protein
MWTDVTDIVQRYRLALRYIWNCCFWVDPSLRNWDSVDSFRRLKLPLFRALVGDPLDLEPGDEIFGTQFEVVPHIQEGLPSLQVNLNVPSSPAAGVWEPLKGPFKADEITLSLVDFFDWTPMGYIDLRYYVVRIESFRAHPDRVGQHALVDVAHAAVCRALPAPSGKL